MISSNVATAITKLIAVDAVPMLCENLLLGLLVDREFDPVVGHIGQVVQVGLEQQPATLIHADASFRIPDVTKVLAVPDLLRLYMTPCMTAMAERIDGDIAALGPAFASTTDDIDIAETLLFTNGVNPSIPKYFICNAKVYGELRQNPNFTEYATARQAGLRNPVESAIGKYRDVFVMRSRAIADTYRGLLFAKGAIGMAMRRLAQPIPGNGAIAEYGEMGALGIRVVLDYCPNSLAQTFNIGVLYGMCVKNPAHGLRLQCD